MLIKDLMKRNPVTLDINQNFSELIKIFSSEEIGSVIITEEDGKIVHIITLRDIPRLIFVDPPPVNIPEVLKILNKNKDNLISIGPEDTFFEALNLMRKHNISHLPVVESDGRVIGIVSLRNILKSVPEIIYLDPLTEIHNRKYLSLVEIKLKKTKGHLNVLMIDIDDFKKINDTYGHLIGDKVLKKLAQVLKKNIKISDEVIRFGGEEFLVILYRTFLSEGMEVAERLRKAVENMEIEEIPELRVTISIGIACYRPGDELSKVIEEADRAMYRAKQKGKNRVEASLLC